MTATDLPSPLRPLPGTPPSGGAEAAAAYLRKQQVEPMAWSNRPGDRYAPHEHAYTKLLLCAEGSITFLVGPDAIPLELGPGDGFELPPGTRHAAVVGDAGCTCVEGHR